MVPPCTTTIEQKSRLPSRGRTRAIRAGAALLAVGAAPMPSAPMPAAPVLAPDKLYLLVASWCAPCRGELARLPALTAAAAPVRVRVVPVDATAGTTAMLRGIDAGAIDRSARTVAALSGQTGGLPYSVMTDRAGERCAVHRTPLDVAAVRRMREDCGG